VADHGPRIVDRRPRAPRRCLRCNTVMRTTADRRICKRCAVINADLVTGAVVEAATVLVLVQVGG
jgi:Zn finger protein HypA/HybF involved in hydrogenase expression